MKKCTPEKLANKWIREMQKANFTPDQMLECLKVAREKYEAIVYTRKRFKELHEIATAPTLENAIVNAIRLKAAQDLIRLTAPAPKSELGGMITGNGFIEWLKKNQQL